MTPNRILPRALGRQTRQSLLWGIFWVIAIVLIAVTVNVIGIRVLGNVAGWARWLKTHQIDFLFWRLALYGATAWAWWWMRERVRQREPGAQARLIRIEIAAVLVVLALESVALFQL